MIFRTKPYIQLELPTLKFKQPAVNLTTSCWKTRPIHHAVLV